MNFELVRDVVAWLVAGADGSKMPVGVGGGQRRGSLLPAMSGGGKSKVGGAILIFLQVRQHLCLAFPLLLWLRHRLCLVGSSAFVAKAAA